MPRWFGKKHSSITIIMEALLVFKAYTARALAEQAAQLLRQNNIDAEIDEEAALLDGNYLGQRFNEPFLLRVRGSDFDKATQLLEARVIVNLDEVDPDYMLLSFTDEELIDVMKKKDEWGIYNYKLAEALLRQRNVPIPEMEIVLEQAERLREKEKPASSDIIFLLVGYIAVIYGIVLWVMSKGIGMIIPGGFAFLVGWHLAYFKRTLSNGQQTFYYNSSTRFQGTIIFWAAIALVAVQVLFFLIYFLLK